MSQKTHWTVKDIQDKVNAVAKAFKGFVMRLSCTRDPQGDPSVHVEAQMEIPVLAASNKDVRDVLTNFCAKKGMVLHTATVSYEQNPTQVNSLVHSSALADLQGQGRCILAMSCMVVPPGTPIPTGVKANILSGSVVPPGELKKLLAASLAERNRVAEAEKAKRERGKAAREKRKADLQRSREGALKRIQDHLDSKGDPGAPWIGKLLHQVFRKNER